LTENQLTASTSCAQDTALSEALCGRSHCDGAMIFAALAPVLPRLLPAEVAEVAEAVAALQPASLDAAQLLLFVASRCMVSPALRFARIRRI
jgi:hypothetical protein